MVEDVAILFSLSVLGASLIVELVQGLDELEMNRVRYGLQDLNLNNPLLDSEEVP